tara:strand:+ start:639 stop:1385 length:747 start_codon:yes stop_codon:yes gene_type:complete
MAQSFNQAFAAARKAGVKTFSWTDAKGKTGTYHTRTKDEDRAKRKPGDPMHGPHRRGGSIPRYQDRGEIGTAGQQDAQQISNDQAAQKRAMMQQAMNQSGPQGGPMRDVEQGSDVPVPQRMQQQAMNQVAQYQQQLHAQKQEQFQQLLQELQVKNQQLEQQNQLLTTKIQKDEMINNARTIPSNLQKAITSPKKRGGSFSRGGSKKKVKILGSNGSVATVGGGGGQNMKRGGACGLPGGRSDMKRRRR